MDTGWNAEGFHGHGELMQVSDRKSLGICLPWLGGIEEGYSWTGLQTSCLAAQQVSQTRDP
jgi:hypothetical protein